MDIPKFLFEISELANQAGQNIYLVGGAVRDLLLGEKVYDFDLLCDKNAIELAKSLQEKKYAELKSVHEPFGTAKVFLRGQQIELDLATTREETYDFPGALPKVKYPCSVEEDLKRRDFTINSIALNLLPNGETEFVDPYDGRSDLQKKVIKVLHSKSYWEDPTRIIRAIRFAIRFGYQLPKEDIEQIQKALEDDQLHEMTKQIRGVRFGIELKRLLELPLWLEGARLISEYESWDLIRENLLVNLQEPKSLFNSWDTRLVWILWNNEPLIQEICSELGVAANIQKQTNKAREIVKNPSELSISRFKEIEALSVDFQNLLFSLNPSIKEDFEFMKKALPTETPNQLMENGFKGKEIGDELERIFQENLREF